MPAESIDCCVTSIPYWRQRDYGTGEWVGGNSSCPHRPADTPGKRGLASSTLGGGKRHTGHQKEGYRLHCPRCGARRINDRQIGQEATVEEWVRVLVEVFEEAKRVLRPEGTLWINVGEGKRDGKQMPGAPWRLAFALQEAGWFLRHEIIWHIPNAMPENVPDRPTRSHEKLFLLSKSERYHFDHEAIRLHEDARIRDVWTIPTEPADGDHPAPMPVELARRCILAGSPPNGKVLDPFGGSGAVAEAAVETGRRAVLIELNPTFVEIAKKRLRRAQPGFAIG